MAQKRQTIVIKKVYIQATGYHGGSWKVALADFMTAMMAFFLVMWLIGQSDDTKKAVSDYFSTPSVIEYNFQNFGAEITLEKLFLDLINEPLKAMQSFMEPSDKTLHGFQWFVHQIQKKLFKSDLCTEILKIIFNHRRSGKVIRHRFFRVFTLTDQPHDKEESHHRRHKVGKCHFPRATMVTRCLHINFFNYDHLSLLCHFVPRLSRCFFNIFCRFV